jgi:hypothetical protein
MLAMTARHRQGVSVRETVSHHFKYSSGIAVIERMAMSR